jgi:type VI secretion system secreted protein VgrG
MPGTAPELACSVTTPLGKDQLILNGLSGVESVSAPFAFNLELSSVEHETLDFVSLMGKAITVELATMDGGQRYLSGIVASLTQADLQNGRAIFQVQMVPWLWLLTRRIDCRIFQNKTVPDILKEVLGAYDFADYRLALSGNYEPWGYCVQYRETDFNFISRLMEHEGLFYYFEHGDNRHKLVVCDDSASCPRCPGRAVARYLGPGADLQLDDEIGAWTREQQLQPSRCALSDYNFLDPSTALLATSATALANGLDEKFEVFDYPGGFVNLGPEPADKLDKGDRWARLRMQAEDAAGVSIRGSGNCRALTPGYSFELRDHFREDNNQAYFITSVHHSLRQGGDVTGDTASTYYENSFTCLPRDIPYRPRLTAPTPVMHGPQTALVVGVKGEEIDVDRYGRIKVQFHWDRYGKADENSSCWIRVSQSSAGKRWGFVSHPRVGQEVVVEFLDGDPNRPLVTGVVYNAEHMPPFDLPANRSQTGFRSRSTLKGESANVNELNFEDKKGLEEVLLHAERDLTVEVEHNRSLTVETGNDAVVVKQGDASLEVSQGSRSIKVPTGTHELDAMKIVLKADTELLLECGTGKISINAAGIVTIQGTMVKIN